MKTMMMFALETIGEIEKGSDLAQVILQAMDSEKLLFQDGDVLVVTQKIVSKAEGRFVNLNQLTISDQAIELAAQSGKESAICQAILNESNRISRVREGVIIAETHHGFICANAGIDQSNTGKGENKVLLLPKDPDKSAWAISQGIQAITGLTIPVVINDTQGRPFRNGAVGVAVGVTGMEPLMNLIGNKDRYGRVLKYSVEAVADEMAAAATLLMGQGDEGLPAVIIRGCSYTPGNGQISSLVRCKKDDLYG